MKHRRYLIFLLCVVAMICWMLPLLQILGYESAALFGALSGIASLFATLHDTNLSHDDRLAENSPIEHVLHQLLCNLPLVLIPGAILSLSGVVITNCDPSIGLLMWGFIPVFSVAIGTVFGVVIQEGCRRPRWRTVLGVGVVLLSGVDLLWRLAIDPPIIGTNLFIGYFAGSIYDEALSLPTSLIYYRILNLGLLFSLTTLLQARWLLRQHRPWQATGFVSLTFIVLTGFGYAYRQEAGVDQSRASIAEALGGRLETPHFIIYYDASEAFPAQRVSQLIEDHEFRYQQLKAFFQEDPVAEEGRKMTSFIYADHDQKGRFTGGRRTMVAKIWLNEMHLVWDEFGESLLAHEMAHLFTRGFAAGPLKLSTQWGIGINMGLVEGIAMAAEWNCEEFSPHEASAALLRMEGAPDLEQLLSASGFWTQSSGLAYRMVGSFLRYLVDQYGIERVKVAYPHGEFELAYQKSLEELVSEWKQFLGTLPWTQDDLARAESLLAQRSIFTKVCPRTIADLELQSQRFQSMGRWEEAEQIQKSIQHLDPYDVSFRLDAIQVALRRSQATGMLDDSGRQEAQLALTQLLNEGERQEIELTTLDQASITAMLGDLSFSGDPNDPSHDPETRREALEWYTQAKSLGGTRGLRRNLDFKEAVLKHASDAGIHYASRVLINEQRKRFTEYDLMQWESIEPKDPLAAYLVARRLVTEERWHEAQKRLLALISSAPFDTLPPSIHDETRRLAVQALYFDRAPPNLTLNYQRARQEIRHLRASNSSSSREFAQVWSDRFDFLNSMAH